MNTPLISVLVPSFSPHRPLRDMLLPLLRQQTEGRFRHQIVVLDGAHSDGTRDLVSEVAANSPVPVNYVRHDLNRETSGWNWGIEKSSAPWLALVREGHIPDARWLVELFHVATATSAPIVGGESQLDLTHHELATLGDVCRRSLRETRLYSQVRPYDPPHWPDAGNVLVARAVFDTVGRFEESNSTELAQRKFFEAARRSGFCPWYAPRAIVRQRVPAECLSPDYFRRRSLVHGTDDANAHARQKLRLAAKCVGRITRTTLVEMPLLAWSWLRRDRGAVLGWRTSLWNCEGFVRKSASILVPKLFGNRQPDA